MRSLHNFVYGLDLRKIKHMIALAEHGSFWKAADATNITQPALSRSIQSLEDALGVQLFERGGRGVELTPVGHACIEAAGKILRSAAEFHEKVMSAADQETIELRIGLGSVTASLLGAPILNAYAEHYAGLHVQLVVDAPERLYKLLLEEELDLVVGNTEVISRASDFDIETVGHFARGFFVRAGHALSGQATVSIEELGRYPVGTTYPLPDRVVSKLRSTYGLSSIDGFFQFRSNHYNGLFNLMEKGDAIIFGSNIAYLEQVRAGAVIRLPVRPNFSEDMALTIASIAGRPPAAPAGLLNDVIMKQMATWTPSSAH